MQQRAHETGPIQYPLHQPRPIQAWFRAHRSEPRIPDKAAPAGLSPLRRSDFGRKSSQTGPIVRQIAAPKQPDFVIVEPDLTAKPVTPLPTLSPEPITPDWLIAAIPAREEECETVEREKKGH